MEPFGVEPLGFPSRPLHPGMLSAALQGNLPPSHQQPPTPPRTPQVGVPGTCTLFNCSPLPAPCSLLLFFLPRATSLSTRTLTPPPSPCSPRCRPFSRWRLCSSRCLASQVRLFIKISSEFIIIFFFSSKHGSTKNASMCYFIALDKCQQY